VEPIPDTGLSSPTPNVIESDDERAARRRGLMQAAAAESRAIMAADLAAVPRLSSYTGRDDNAADEESPIAEEVAAQAYLRTALLASADLRQACETRRDQMLKTGASEDDVFDALLNIARAHSEASPAPSAPIGSFDAVMTAWERDEKACREISTCNHYRAPS
jgi:hypothetical protein